MAQTPNSPFKVRLPPELREELDRAAEANNRSVTAEMVFRLEESFRLEQVAATRRMIDEVAAINQDKRDREEIFQELVALEVAQKTKRQAWTPSSWAFRAQSLEEAISTLRALVEAIDRNIEDRQKLVAELAQQVRERYEARRSPSVALVAEHMRGAAARSKPDLK